MELLTDPHAWLAFVTLTVLEIVLGIDNIVFISVIVSRLPAAQRRRARAIGLALALVFRIILLLMLAWLIGLTEPIFTVLEHPVSWRDIILMAGGFFLLYKATQEIHDEIEGETEAEEASRKRSGAFSFIIGQIILIDIIFSVDSIVTAIGMAEDVEVMIAAVIVAVAVMFVAANAISGVIEQHPTIKMLALSFLLLVGISLVADGLGFHIPRGYVYFAMAFSATVEVFNIRVRGRKRGPGRD
jgi:predicted tellurium resistance membrane protein TerC